jgi:hypothetical protein
MRALLIFLIACNSGAATTPDGNMPPGDAPPPITLTGTPILATAQLGTGEALIGTTADVLFNQVNGDTIFTPRLTQTTVNQITTGWVQAETTTQLAANIAGWGVGSAALDVSNKTRYMSMRAYQIDYYEDVDLTKPDKLAPPTAVYFVSRIYFGHSYEALFSGTESTFTAAVAATLPQASGSIQATAASDNLSATNVGRGLVPNSGTAIFAQSQGDVMANYMASGPSVPIFVEYRLIPGIAEPPGTQIPWSSPYSARIAIDEIDVFHNGSFLDASNTAWSVSTNCSINGAVVDQNDPVWTQSSVSAGGSDVNSDGSGPQDPNTGSPTSTYGRYASLAWSKSFPISTGNTLRCDVGGQRTDPSTPVELPNVAIVVPVDVTTDVDDRAGNYDTGNRLDYQLHYTVTYTAN